MIDYMASAGPHISVKVDEVFNAAGVSITNSHLMGFLGLIVLVWVMFRTRAAVNNSLLNLLKIIHSSRRRLSVLLQIRVVISAVTNRLTVLNLNYSINLPKHIAIMRND
jgi:hypothetical protein